MPASLAHLIISQEMYSFRKVKCALTCASEAGMEMQGWEWCACCPSSRASLVHVRSLARASLAFTCYGPSGKTLITRLLVWQIENGNSPALQIWRYRDLSKSFKVKSNLYPKIWTASQSLSWLSHSFPQNKKSPVRVSAALVFWEKQIRLNQTLHNGIYDLGPLILNRLNYTDFPKEWKCVK